jgi:hypothetical protein
MPSRWGTAAIELHTTKPPPGNQSTSQGALSKTARAFVRPAVAISAPTFARPSAPGAAQCLGNLGAEPGLNGPVLPSLIRYYYCTISSIQLFGRELGEQGLDELRRMDDNTPRNAGG